MHYRKPKARMVPKVPTRQQAQLVKVNEQNPISTSRAVVRIEIDNYTGHIVRTVDHMGLCLIHNPTTTVPDKPEFVNKLVIRKRITVQSAIQVTSVVAGGSSLTGDSDALDITTSLVEDVNRGGKARVRNAGVALAYDYDMIEAEGCVYVREFDLLLQSADAVGSFIHPNSKEYFDHRIEQLYDGAHTYTIELNEVRKTNNAYYANISGTVYTVLPTNHDDIGDTFKISFKSPTGATEVVATGLLSEINKLEEYGIFKNYQDADNYGKKLELQQVELARDTALIKANAARDQAQFDQSSSTSKQSLEEQAIHNKMTEMNKKLEVLEAERTAQAAKHMVEQDKLLRDLEHERERHRRDMDSMRLKDYYEDRSFGRKDTSETMKFLPVLVGGALALFSMYNK